MSFYSKWKILIKYKKKLPAKISKETNVLKCASKKELGDKQNYKQTSNDKGSPVIKESLK